MAKARLGYMAGSPLRVVHVSLRELRLPRELDDRYGLEPFTFDAETLSTLAVHLPKRAIKDLHHLCANLRRHPPYLGTDSRANAPTAVERQIWAAANLANALRTVLDHLRFGHAGRLLAQRHLHEESRQNWHGSADLATHLATFEGVALQVISEAGAIQAPATRGRPQSAPVDTVAWIAAITAAHKLPISKAADAPFMKVCNCLWHALGIKTEATHAVRRFVGALNAGRINVEVVAALWRAYQLRSDSTASTGYRVAVIRDWRAARARAAAASQ